MSTIAYRRLQHNNTFAHSDISPESAVSEAPRRELKSRTPVGAEVGDLPVNEVKGLPPVAERASLVKDGARWK